MASRGVCAVVGCGPGMGGSAAVKFAKEGYKIAAMCRTASSFEPTAAKLKEMGANYAFFEMDATDKASIASAFGEAAKALQGPVDVLVYNCGGGGFGISIMDIDPETFKKSFDASCVGALLCSQAVIPGMLAREGGGEFAVKKRGTLIFSSATSAFRGGSGTAQFACGKHALRALSQSIAKEYGKQGIHAVHVRLDCVLDTPGYQKKMPEMYAAHKMGCTDDIAETYFALAQQSPLGWSNEVDIRPFQEGWSC
ncbi:yoxD [Symbiodinium sp. CCMP2592]|nr:yoxD [Symbiodinium sp. CCMP2592]